MRLRKSQFQLHSSKKRTKKKKYYRHTNNTEQQGKRYTRLHESKKGSYSSSSFKLSNKDIVEGEDDRITILYPR